MQKTLTPAQIMILMRKAKTLEQTHELAVILCKALAAKYEKNKG